MGDWRAWGCHDGMLFTDIIARSINKRRLFINSLDVSVIDLHSDIHYCSFFKVYLTSISFLYNVFRNIIFQPTNKAHHCTPHPHIEDGR